MSKTQPPAKPPAQRNLFALVLKETAAERPPTIERLIALSGLTAAEVRDAIGALVESGRVALAYEGGPVMPKLSGDGISIKTMMIFGEERALWGSDPRMLAGEPGAP